QLTVVQIGAWLLFAWFVIRLFKDKYQNARDQEKALLLTLVFIFSYIPILLGGYRLWFHYFIQYLPALVLIAAYQFSLSKDWILSKARWTLKLSVYGPLLFFIGWHSYDIYKKYYVDNPLTPTNYNYLVERPELKAVTAWIRENSSPEDSIFVWGYSPQIYYFSQRRMGGRFLSLSHITLDNSNLDKKTGGLSQYRKTRSGEDLDRLFKLLLKDFKNKKPKYIIDTSGTSLTDYKKDSPDNYPIVDYYLKENYKQVKEISGVIILEREDYFLETAFQ
ncbi:MAG: hypothetical protein OEZ36_01970, partial [Spirochaetota bacterium]|nr:hypothetical protein [Spirochaetota bacterium]